MPTYGPRVGQETGSPVYDVITRTLQSIARLYHLYIDFNKAFDLLPLKALWILLCEDRPPKQLLCPIGGLYADAYD